MASNIDWRAVLVGAVASCVSLVVFLLFSVGIERIGVLNLSSASSSITFLLFILAILPGAIIAGYLHGSTRRSGAIYGIVAVTLGVTLPGIAIGIGLQIIIGVPLSLFAIFSLTLIVAWTAIGVFSGGFGGALGASLKGDRSD